MRLSGRTRVLGIFGDPVAHSLSPIMQNAALQQADVDAVYVPFHVKPSDLGDAVAAIRRLAMQGVNITVPHKETVCAHLDEIEESARLIGAVNTIVNREGRLFGYNTDAGGFLRALAEDLDFNPRDKKVLLLGAGGACRAALVALCHAGAAKVEIANRTASRSESLVKQFFAIFPDTCLEHSGLEADSLKKAAAEVDLIVNTSAVGLKGESFSLPWQDIDSRTLFYDMVYGHKETPLLQEARQRGHRAVDGLGMLAGQGEEAFQLWTDKKAPAGLMRSILQQEVSGS